MNTKPVKPLQPPVVVENIKQLQEKFDSLLYGIDTCCKGARQRKDDYDHGFMSAMRLDIRAMRNFVKKMK